MDTTTTDWVEIKVNGTPHRMHPGNHTGAQVKNAGGVAAADELDQVVQGELTLVADDAPITIVGGEVFLSHPPSGGSS